MPVSNPGNPNPGNPYPGNPGGVAYPGQTMTGRELYPAIPGQPFPGQPFPGQPFPGQPGPPVNTQIGGVSPYPTQGNFGASPAYPQPGMTTGAQGANTAAAMIQQILTTPRPGGMPQGGIGGLTVGGGIAGVASNSEGEGVMVYNDRTVYKEWEFIFDPSKVKPLQNPNAVTGTLGGTPASQMGSMPPQSGMTPVGGGPLNQNNPFGTPAQVPRPGR
jgi:hypothetical protein